jgi:class 3 adenylate cyclase/CheY-like chemotaxis protein
VILVVDDLPQNVRLLRAVLEPRGYVVVEASSGPEALSRLGEGDIDLVLLDVMMPLMDGYEICRRIRADPVTAFLPVVMITASGEAEKRRGLDAGADDFVAKPFNQQELLARVRSLVRIKRYHDTIETQRAELAEWNKTLAARVESQVEELERMQTLRRFLSPTLAELILSQGESILESHRREIAVLFADLRGWTAFSVNTEPEEVMSVIREFHSSMGSLIREFEATVGWFAGDGLMVWFNDPVPCPDPSLRAVHLGTAMRTAMTGLTRTWRRRGHELDFSAGIGLGYATLGRIGFDGRYDYGAVGTVMNLAARLCDEAKAGEILVSERVYAEVENDVTAEPAGALPLKGFVKPVATYRIVDVITAGADTSCPPEPSLDT